MTRLLGLALAIVMSSTLAACSANPCDSFGGQTCIAVDVVSSAAIVFDQLRVDATQLGVVSESTPEAPREELTLPVRFALLSRMPTFTGALSVTIEAWRQSAPVARGLGSATVASVGEHLSLTITVEPASGVVDGGPTTDGGVDAAPPEDLAGADLFGVDLSGVDASIVSPCGGAVCPPITLVENRPVLNSLAVNDTHVYFLELGPNSNGSESQVIRFPKTTGCVGVVAGCLDILDDRSQVDTIALSSDLFCWTERPYNERSVICGDLPLTGFTDLAINQLSATQPVIEGADVFWINQGDSALDSNGTVMTTPKTATSMQLPVTLASGRPFPTDLAVDAAYIYWTEVGTPAGTGKVMRADRNGQNPIALASNQTTAGAIAIYGEYVYWTAKTPGEIHRAKKDASGMDETIVTGQHGPYDLVVDSSGIYWINFGTGPNFVDGQIQHALLDGSGVIEMAASQPRPSAIAQDAEFVYWITQGTSGGGYLDGTVMKVSKTY